MTLETVCPAAALTTILPARSRKDLHSQYSSIIGLLCMLVGVKPWCKIVATCTERAEQLPCQIVLQSVSLHEPLP